MFKNKMILAFDIIKSYEICDLQSNFQLKAAQISTLLQMWWYVFNDFFCTSPLYKREEIPFMCALDFFSFCSGIESRIFFFFFFFNIRVYYIKV